MVFDDSYEHEVWVGGRSPRIVLILDFYRPELTTHEIEFLTRLDTEPTPYFGNDSLQNIYVKTRTSPNPADVKWVYEGRLDRGCLSSVG